MKQIKGTPLRPSISIANEFYKPVAKALEVMAKEIKDEMRGVFAEYSLDGAMDAGSLPIQAQFALNRILKKWTQRFNDLSDRAVAKMIKQITANSKATLGMSLKDLSDSVTLDTGLIDDKLRQIIRASTEESTNLIKLIPQKYIADVQGQVMRSISGGGGLQTLIPYLNNKYNGDKRHARNTALDQTRKAYNNITAGRMQSLGFKKYQWLHVGGSQHPRQDHIAMSGNVYNLEDPPIIGTMYGQEVRGKPGDLPACRCQIIPIISFEE